MGYEPKHIGPGVPCYYDATPMQTPNGINDQSLHTRRLVCPTCGLTILYNVRNSTWLRIKDGQKGA